METKSAQGRTNTIPKTKTHTALKTDKGLTDAQKRLSSPRTILFLIIYGIISLQFFVIFTPSYYCAAEWWEILIIVLLFLTAISNMLYFDTYTDRLEGLDSKGIDLWTIVHFLAGCVSGVSFPFLWMEILNVGWEILEHATTGLGDMEMMANRILDAIAVTLGWFVVVIALFYQDRFNDFPWIWGNGCHDWIV